MGGIGKTQLVVEFCHQYGRFFNGVHWIQMPTGQEVSNAKQNIDAEIAACGEAMCIPRWPEKLPEQVALTLKTWEESGDRLIVLDSIEDPSATRDLMARLSKARLLLTSRSSNWSAHIGLKTLKLDVFTRPQSIELLRKIASRLKDASESELDAIAQRLGDLPLALDLAGCYLKECFDASPASSYGTGCGKSS